MDYRGEVAGGASTASVVAYVEDWLSEVPSCFTCVMAFSFSALALSLSSFFFAASSFLASCFGVGFWALLGQGCQMAKFDPFLSLDFARVVGVGAQSKERKGSNFAIWQPCP